VNARWLWAACAAVSVACHQPPLPTLQRTIAELEASQRKLDLLIARQEMEGCSRTLADDLRRARSPDPSDAALCVRAVIDLAMARAAADP
jgi:hypothetical protein